MKLERVWLATDLGDAATGPWAHALRVCVTSGADLRVLHVHQGEPGDWRRLPTLRGLLTAWGFLPGDASLADFAALKFRVRMDAMQAPDARGLIGAMVQVQRPDLLVVGTHRPGAAQRLFDGSVAEALARQSPGPTLIVPDGARPLVDPALGSVRLRKVLIPLGETGALAALDAAGALVDALQEGPVEFVFVHVGPYREIPQAELPERADWSYRTVNHREGPVVQRVLETATREDVDLVAMATHGHDSLADSVRGSHTERVLRGLHVPLLAVPYSAGGAG